jgi:hypothetical protein
VCQMGKRNISPLDIMRDVAQRRFGTLAGRMVESLLGEARKVLTLYLLLSVANKTRQANFTLFHHHSGIDAKQGWEFQSRRRLRGVSAFIVTEDPSGGWD